MGNENAKRLLEPEQLNRAAALAKTILEQMDRILLGQNELHQMVLIGLLEPGHILLEGVPAGKTAMIKGLGQLMNPTFNRVQFTPDIMPGDILGSHILQEDERGKREMVFEPGRFSATFCWPMRSPALAQDPVGDAGGDGKVT